MTCELYLSFCKKKLNKLYFSLLIGIHLFMTSVFSFKIVLNPLKG